MQTPKRRKNLSVVTSNQQQTMPSNQTAHTQTTKCISKKLWTAYINNNEYDELQRYFQVICSDEYKELFERLIAKLIRYELKIEDMEQKKESFNRDINLEDFYNGKNEKESRSKKFDPESLYERLDKSPLLSQEDYKALLQEYKQISLENEFLARKRDEYQEMYFFEKNEKFVLANKFKDITRDYSKLNSESKKVARLDRKIRDLEESLRVANEKCEEFNDLYKGVQEKKKKLELDYNALLSSKGLHPKVNDLQIQINNLQDNSSTDQEKSERYRRELQTSQQNFNKEKRQLLEQVKKTQYEYNLYKNTNDSYKKLYDDVTLELQNSNNKLIAYNENKAMEFLSQKQQIEVLHEKLSIKQECEENMKNNYGSLEKKTYRLHGMQTDYKDQVEKLENTNKELEKNQDFLDRKFRQNKELLDSYERDNDELRDDLEKNYELVSQLERRIKNSFVELEGKNLMLDKSKQDLKQISEQKLALDKRCRSLEFELINLQECLSKEQLVKFGFQKKNGRLENLLADLNAKENEIMGLNGTIEKLLVEIQQKGERMECLVLETASMEDLKDQLNTLKAFNQKLDSLFNSERAKNIRLNEEIVELNKNIVEKVEKIDYSKTLLRQFSQELRKLDTGANKDSINIVEMNSFTGLHNSFEEISNKHNEKNLFIYCLNKPISESSDLNDIAPTPLFNEDNCKGLIGSTPLFPLNVISRHNSEIFQDNKLTQSSYDNHDLKDELVYQTSQLDEYRNQNTKLQNDEFSNKNYVHKLEKELSDIKNKFSSLQTSKQCDFDASIISQTDLSSEKDEMMASTKHKAIEELTDKVKTESHNYKVASASLKCKEGRIAELGEMLKQEKKTVEELNGKIMEFQARIEEFEMLLIEKEDRNCIVCDLCQRNHQSNNTERTLSLNETVKQVDILNELNNSNATQNAKYSEKKIKIEVESKKIEENNERLEIEAEQLRVNAEIIRNYEILKSEADGLKEQTLELKKDLDQRNRKIKDITKQLVKEKRISEKIEDRIVEERQKRLDLKRSMLNNLNGRSSSAVRAYFLMSVCMMSYMAWTGGFLDDEQIWKWLNWTKFGE